MQSSIIQKLHSRFNKRKYRTNDTTHTNAAIPELASSDRGNHTQRAIEGTSDKHDKPNFVGVLYQTGGEYPLTSRLVKEESEEEDDVAAEQKHTKVIVRKKNNDVKSVTT